MSQKQIWTLYLVEPRIFGASTLKKIARWEGELSLKGLEFMSRHLEAIPEMSPYLILIKRELVKEAQPP